MSTAVSLPDKPSELLTLALDDLEKCEQADGYQIDMDDWHKYDADAKSCSVCLAGSVLAQTAKLDQKTDADFGTAAVADIALHLDVLDDLRRGDIPTGLQKLPINREDVEKAVTTLARTPECNWLSENGYAADADRFKSSLRTIAKQLGELNL